MLLRGSERGFQYLDAGLEELTFGALMHIVIAVIIALSQKKNDNG